MLARKLPRLLSTLSDAAVQRGAEQSTFVCVVGGDSSVTIRPVTLGTAESGVIEIMSDLSAGEVVVLEGMDRLASGSKVAVQMKGQAKEQAKEQAKDQPRTATAPASWLI